MGKGRSWYLIRHGATVGESHIRFHGSGDVALSPTGQGQIQALAPLLSGVLPTRVYHSPLTRALASLEILRSSLGWQAESVPVEEFRELHFGACEGLTKEEIRASFPEFYATWQAGGGYTAFPGGENLAGFTARVAAGVDRILAEELSGDLVLVTHKGVMRRILWRMVGKDAARPEDFDPPLGSMTVVHEDEGCFAIRVVNLLPE